MIYQRCPVCNGRGAVMRGFYEQVDYGSGSSAASMSETCRTCGGSGLLLAPDSPNSGDFTVITPRVRVDDRLDRIRAVIRDYDMAHAEVTPEIEAIRKILEGAP